MQALLAVNTIDFHDAGPKPAAISRRPRQTLCDHGEERMNARTRRSDHRRAGLPGFYLSIGTLCGRPRHAAGDRRETQCVVVAALAEPAVVRALDDLGRGFFPSAQQTPQMLAACTRPKSTSGGRSSKRPASSRSETPAGIVTNEWGYPFRFRFARGFAISRRSR